MSSRPPVQSASPNSTIRVSGVVVTYNEDEHLGECLRSLCFCDELVVMDLGSKDRSVEIAKAFGARIVTHPWVPIVEHVREAAMEAACHDWIVMLDPDEIMTPQLSREIEAAVSGDPKCAGFRVPWKFYFKNRPLRGTRWGGVQSKLVVLNRKHLTWAPWVHRGIQKPAAAEIRSIRARDGNDLKHYWANSYSELFVKHRRYLQFEGESRYQNGQRFGWINIATSPLWEFGKSLIWHRGVLDGFDGVLLSLFWGWYNAMCWLWLRRFENRDDH